MTVADKIAEAKAALEELANMPLGISLADWSRLSSPILEALIAAPDADAQAQEIARLRAGPYVKPLEWRDLTYGMQPHWTANHSFGSIDIRQEGEDLEWRWVVRPFIGGRSNWPTLEEAKADAEADYRARVRAALGAAP